MQDKVVTKKVCPFCGSEDIYERSGFWAWLTGKKWGCRKCGAKFKTPKTIKEKVVVVSQTETPAPAAPAAKAVPEKKAAAEKPAKKATRKPSTARKQNTITKPSTSRKNQPKKKKTAAK